MTEYTILSKHLVHTDDRVSILVLETKTDLKDDNHEGVSDYVNSLLLFTTQSYIAYQDQGGHIHPPVSAYMYLQS